MARIDTLAALAERYPNPIVPSALEKVSPVLTPLYRKWIEGSRFCILSTVGQNGVHGSPRGDDGPVVQVADTKTLLMPDWRGNNRLECLRDIVEDGRIALLFLVPGSKTTVRVNGQAHLVDDDDLRERFRRKSTLPATVIVIDIAEIYTQCAKALMRSGLWDRDDRETVPTVGDILADMTHGTIDAPEYDRTYEERAKPRMW